MAKMKPLVLIIFTLLPLSFNSYSQEKADTVKIIKSNEVAIPDNESLLAENTARIDSLMSANSALKGLLKDSQKEIEAKDRELANLKREIDDLQNITIKRLEASNDTLQRRLISMASNFLYIPYDEYSIDEIAIPAFISTKGTPLYERYQNRLPLLQNYKADISDLVSILTQMEKDLGTGLTSMTERKASEHLDSLKASPLYKRYTSYDDWEYTYLGDKIKRICLLLKSPTKETHIKLKDFRESLEKLLNNG